MLQNTKQLSGRKLSAIDGPIGQIADFYFDDEIWRVRYVVVDTGAWLAGRKVLLSPLAFGSKAFGRSDVASDVLVDLTRSQIQGSPPLDLQRPVSRRYEEDYHRHFGWPTYWPEHVNSPTAGAAKPGTAEGAAGNWHHQRDDLRLRSTHATIGYRLRATDGEIGAVSSFNVDRRNWTIREIVVETGNWFSSKPVIVLPENIQRIDYEDSTVFVNLTKEDVTQTMKNDVVQMAVGRD